MRQKSLKSFVNPSQCCQIWRKFAKWAKFKGKVAMDFLHMAMAKFGFKIAKNGRNQEILLKLAIFLIFFQPFLVAFRISPKMI